MIMKLQRSLKILSSYIYLIETSLGIEKWTKAIFSALLFIQPKIEG